MYLKVYCTDEICILIFLKKISFLYIITFNSRLQDGCGCARSTESSKEIEDSGLILLPNFNCSGELMVIHGAID